MTEQPNLEHFAAGAGMRTKRGFSIIWVVPLVALVVGCWLAIKAINEKGPTISIIFENAAGLEAGKTKIRYRDVEIGQITEIGFVKDTPKVLVKARLIKESEPYLTDTTRFWVVRAEVKAGNVSGLGTILSGAYIGVDPRKDGKPTKTFNGLERPPVVTHGQPGSHFWLHADRLGSLDIGAPVYYRQIQVGTVVGYDFSKDGRQVDIQVFIEAPHHLRVTKNTRFWNASGFDFSLNAQGLKVDTESVVSIVRGGIAFDLPGDLQPGPEAEENASFRLYADRESIMEKSYAIRRQWILVFDQSVRGLAIGAPVELYGIKVGEVSNLELVYDGEIKNFRVPVMVTIEPERVKVINSQEKLLADDQGHEALLKWLVEERGLRAQLQSGNLLTGQLMINLGFHPGAEKATLAHIGKYPVVPTIPGAFERLQENLVEISDKLEKIPFDQIGGDIQALLGEARNSLKDIGDLARTVDQGTVPQLQQTLAALEKTLGELQGMAGKDSPLVFKAGKTMEELALTLRSLRELATSLELQPQSIIFGKEKEKNETTR